MTSIEHLLAEALYACFEMEQAMGHLSEHLAHALRQQGGMYLEMEAQVGMVLGKEVQEVDGMARMIVEGAVENAHIAYPTLTDMVEAVTYCIEGEQAYGVAQATDTEGTRVEAATRGLDLHKGLAPSKQGTLLGDMQRGEVHHTSMASIVIGALVEVA